MGVLSLKAGGFTGTTPPAPESSEQPPKSHCDCSRDRRGIWPRGIWRNRTGKEPFRLPVVVFLCASLGLSPRHAAGISVPNSKGDCHACDIQGPAKSGWGCPVCQTRSAKRGETKKSALKGASREMEKSMTEAELKDLASTKHGNKPEHVDDSSRS